MEWPISCQSGRTKNKVGFSLGTKTIHHYIPICDNLNISNTVFDCIINSYETLLLWSLMPYMIHLGSNRSQVECNVIYIP